jgi:hypothetical protein
MVDLEGFEPSTGIDNTQVVDSVKWQKRLKRPKRQFEVHGGYTDSLACGGLQCTERAHDPFRFELSRAAA